MNKILIVGEFNQGTSSMKDFLSMYFDAQLCTLNGKILKSMLKMYQPQLVLMGIDDFGPEQQEIFEAIDEYSDKLPIITYGDAAKTDLFNEFYVSGQCSHVSELTEEDLIRAICGVLNVNADSILNGSAEPAKKHILVIDDNNVLLRNLRKMLEEYYRVSLANSANQGMKLLEEDNVDLIILDYEMPEIDGREALEMIRANEKLKDIPVIFLTGIADKPHVDAVLDLKPAGYFVKPPMQAKMLNSIENIFAKEESKRQ